LPGDGRGFMKQADKVKRAVSDQVETVKQSVDAAGNGQLQLDSPVATSGCYGRLIVGGGGRPAMFTVSSYNAPSNESFPSFMLQAQTAAADGTTLASAPLDAVVFVQEAKDGPVWQSPTDRPVKVTVTSAADGALSGEATGVLISSDTGAEKPFSATFSGSFAVGAP
jgi:hypothetical protein